MSPAEAAAWRDRIAIWLRFGRGGQSLKLVADPLLDDPDPLLPEPVIPAPLEPHDQLAIPRRLR